jgi:pimeloyl-ACP methyl ester carboxylesterase
MIRAGIDYAEQGDGRPVICLHGIGGTAESFRQQLEGLRGCRVIAWNMPGYGRSAARPLSFRALSTALSDLIRALDLEDAHLVGHSIGGMLAIEHALTRPVEVRSLSLIGATSSFGGRDEGFKEAFLKARLGPLEAGLSMAEMAAKAAPNLVGPVADRACIEAIEREMATISEVTWRQAIQCLTTFDRRDDFGDITQPTCLIAGSEDRNAPARTMRKMAAALAGSAFHEIAGAGHMIHQEAPSEVNAILQAFLDGQDR